MAAVWCVYDVQGARDASENAFEVYCADADAPTLAELEQSCPFIRNSPGAWRWRARVEDEAFGHCWRDVREGREPVPTEASGDGMIVRMRLLDVSPAAIARRRLKPGRAPRARRAAGKAPAPARFTDAGARVPAARAPNGAPPRAPPARVPPPNVRAPPLAPPRRPSVDMVDLGEAPPVPPRPAPNKQSLDTHAVERLVKEGKMAWDEIDKRYVAVEQVEAARAGIQAVRLDGPVDLSSKTVEVQQAILERRANLAAAQEEKRARLRKQRTQAADEDNQQIDLKARLDPQLTAWSEDHGRKKNIRALLGGMDKVMWEGSGWVPMSIGDLLEPKKVKRAYYRASCFVHPDKLVGLSVEQRFVGKRVFDALSQAYSDFEEAGHA